MLQAEDKTVFMPGPLSSGHHQLAESCDSCHTDPLGGGPVLQESCIGCHGDQRQKPFDSHPAKKFKDPRNADMLNLVDATQCVSCHKEHKPEITLANGLTQPKDVCFHCHQDIAEERPSHDGMGFETCASSGCHSFHNNRALYFDFLIRYKDSPNILEAHSVPTKEFTNVLDILLNYPRDDYPVEPLTIEDADAISFNNLQAETDTDDISEQWAKSSHAQSGVNCSACHQAEPTDKDATTDKLSEWIDKPGTEGCVACHEMEVQGFEKGKHGMRLQAGLTPMTPAKAQIPMHPSASHKELTCNSCHTAHDYNVVTASVESCIGCHADDHTAAYKDSTHYALWLAETEGDGEPGTGVSCATCHMPRVSKDVDDYNSRIVVEHNQNATLSPNNKMIRPVCMNCHGLEFAIDALADRPLIDSNFQGLPSLHIQSMDMARELQAEHEEKKKAKSK